MLTAHPPTGVTPGFKQGDSLHPQISGTVFTGKEGQVLLKRTPDIKGRYIFGHGRLQILDNTGFWLFMFSLLFILIHGGARWFSGRN